MGVGRRVFHEWVMTVDYCDKKSEAAEKTKNVCRALRDHANSKRTAEEVP